MNDKLLIAFSLMKAQSILARKFDKLHLHGLGLSDFMILYVLINSPEILINSPENKCRRIDLADQLGITASGITRLLAPLEKIGLVAREAHSRDARVSFVVITETGKEIFNNAKNTAEEAADDVFPNFKAKELATLTKLFIDLDVNFK